MSQSETTPSAPSPSPVTSAAQQTASASSKRGDIRAHLLIVNDTEEPLVDETGAPITIKE